MALGADAGGGRELHESLRREPACERALGAGRRELSRSRVDRRSGRVDPRRPGGGEPRASPRDRRAGAVEVAARQDAPRLLRLDLGLLERALGEPALHAERDEDGEQDREGDQGERNEEAPR